MQRSLQRECRTKFVNIYSLISLLHKPDYKTDFLDKAELLQKVTVFE